MNPEMNGITGFQTARSKLVGAYNQSGAPYIAKTKPYYSTVQLQLQVVTGGFGNSTTIAHAILRAGQTVLAFSYKIGDAIPFGPSGATRPALESDTNLSKPRQTNGVEDFVIEGVSMDQRSLRMDYSSSAYTGTGATDADLLNALGGKAQIFDPASIDCPPQMYSPFNLENAVWEAIKRAITVEIEWDRSRVEKLWRADALFGGNGVSYLRASGVPSRENRNEIPEGYLWRKEGQADSELVVRLITQEAVVVPINLVGPSGQTTNAAPNNLWMDVTVRLHGLSLSTPSQN